MIFLKRVGEVHPSRFAAIPCTMRTPIRPAIQFSITQSHTLYLLLLGVSVYLRVVERRKMAVFHSGISLAFVLSFLIINPGFCFDYSPKNVPWNFVCPEEKCKLSI